MTGGNYWGRPTVNNVANSIKEMLQRNLSTGHSRNHLTTLNGELQILIQIILIFNYKRGITKDYPLLFNY